MPHWPYWEKPGNSGMERTLCSRLQRGQGKRWSDMTLTKVLRATGLADRATVHGFRSSFRDWADICTSAPDAAVELSLAHEVGSEVRQAYAQSDLLDLRQPLLDAWAEYITEGIDIYGH